MLSNIAFQRRRRGFASTLLVLALMATLSVLTVVCVKTLANVKRQQRIAIIETQLEWMVLASEQWIAAGGTLIAGESVTLELPTGQPRMTHNVRLNREGDRINGIATIRQASKQIGVRHFFVLDNTN